MERLGLNKIFSIGNKGIIAFLAILMTILVGASVSAESIDSVTNYQINSAVETGAGEITVNAQAQYCTACNPNPSGAPGCTAFGHLGSCLDGTYIAARILDSTSTVLSTKKIILQQPGNLTRGVTCNWNFIFSGLSVMAGDTLTVEVDTYCSWCGHWYPTPVNVIVSASNSQVTYTGDTSGTVGTSANVSANLIDTGTGGPLSGKTITFTLDTLPPVSAVTDTAGNAATTLAIPPTMTIGTYDMTARFAGDINYFGHSDTVDFDINKGGSGCDLTPVLNALELVEAKLDALPVKDLKDLVQGLVLAVDALEAKSDALETKLDRFLASGEVIEINDLAPGQGGVFFIGATKQPKPDKPLKEQQGRE